MKKLLLAAVLGLGLMASACADTGARTLESLYALDATFADAQSIAIVLIDDNVLSGQSKAWIKDVDHLVSEELKALTDRAIAHEQGNPVSVSAADLAKVQSDVQNFRTQVQDLKKGTGK